MLVARRTHAPVHAVQLRSKADRGWGRYGPSAAGAVSHRKSADEELPRELLPPPRELLPPPRELLPADSSGAR